MECRPYSEFVFVVSEKFNLLGRDWNQKGRPPVRINHEEFLPVVTLPLHKSDEQVPGSLTEHIRQKTSIQVVFQGILMSHCMLTVPQWPRIAASAGCSTLLEFVIGRIREAQHKALIALDKLVLFGE